MKPLGLLPIFIGLYALIWITLVIGILLIRKGTPSAQKMRTWFLKKRIGQFQYPPFKTLLTLWIAGRFFRASLTFLFLIIIPAVFFFLSGYWIPLVICTVVNAFGEVAGPIYWKMTGPISLEVLARGEPIDNNDPEYKVNPS